MKKTLTPKEQELIPKVRDEWSILFFSLKFNEKDAKKLINFMYELAGLDKPKVVILDSPIEVQKSANQCDEENVRNKVWDNVLAKVWGNVREKVWDKIGDNVGDNVFENIFYDVRDYVLDKVLAKVWNKVRNKLNLRYIPDSSYGTSSNFFWVSFYDYFQRIGIIKDETFTKYKELIKANIFYIVPFEKTCFISRPPLYIKRDEDGRLHSEKGYAVEFKDGWGLRYVHGEFVGEDGN
jgi:hypothetical protein